MWGHGYVVALRVGDVEAEDECVAVAVDAGSDGVELLLA